MGKSYRRPYSAITGVRSAKQDKIHAHRGERRAHARALRECRDWEEFVPPVRHECHGNNVYSWSRDGKTRFDRVDPNTFNPYHCMIRSDYWTEEKILEWHEDRLARHYEWRRRLIRK